MSATSLSNIVADDVQRDKLTSVAYDAGQVIESAAAMKSGLNHAKSVAKSLGLKPMEFNKFVKYYNNPELLYNELAFLQEIESCL